MDWLQVVVLSLVQGITEFLPISSSAHLILTPHLFGWADQGLSFDVAVHVGTLAAVIYYFRRDLIQMLVAGQATVSGGGEVTREVRLMAYVLLATLPSTVVGAVFHDQIDTFLRDPLVIAGATIVFGVALLLANRESSRATDEFQLVSLAALGIGLAQVLAFIPGTSRSGITMLAGVLLGLRRDAAARFSFLMSIPIITGAGLYKTALLIQSSAPVEWLSMVLGALLSAASALVCIHLFLGFIEKIGFTPFVVYRLLLGAVLLVIFV